MATELRGSNWTPFTYSCLGIQSRETPFVCKAGFLEIIAAQLPGQSSFWDAARLPGICAGFAATDSRPGACSQIKKLSPVRYRAAPLKGKICQKPHDFTAQLESIM